jgi:ADP-ribose pyrophosphatase YjhB (NUDIX family)
LLAAIVIAAIVIALHLRYNFSIMAANELSTRLDLWIQRLRAVAQTGLAFDPPVYDRERYEELLTLAAEMAATHAQLDVDAALAAQLYERWRAEVVPGIAGYITPKVGIGAVVFNARDELLLIKRPSGFWFFPTGWADVGYTPAQVAAKEVREETGLQVTPTRLIAAYTINHLLESDMHLHFYSLLFYCRLDGGALSLQPHEALDVGFFPREHLPAPLARAELNWVEHAWAAHRGELREAYFEPL